jgi:peroxiredoxin
MDPIAQIGEPAPDFELQDLNAGWHRLADYKGKLVVLEFWSARCPWCEKVDEEVGELRESWGTDIELVHIASNADEDREQIRQVAKERGHERVLIDAEQLVADAYGAEITPEFFLIDGRGVLRYRGALDDSDFRSEEPTQRYLDDAIHALQRGADLNPAETPGYGCALVRYEPKTQAD